MDDPIATLDQMRRDPRWSQFSRDEQQHIVDTVMQSRTAQTPDRSTGAAGPEQPMGPQEPLAKQWYREQGIAAQQEAEKPTPGFLGALQSMGKSQALPVGLGYAGSVLGAATGIPGADVAVGSLGAAGGEYANQKLGWTPESTARIVGAGAAQGVPMLAAKGTNSLLNWLSSYHPGAKSTLAEANMNKIVGAADRFAPPKPSAPMYEAIDKDPEVRRIIKTVTQQEVPSSILGNASNPANAVPLTTTQNVTTTRGTIPMTAALAKQAENEAYLARLQEHADPKMIAEMRKFPISPNMTLEQVMTQRRNMNSYRGESGQGMTPDAWSYSGKIGDAMRADVAAGSPLGAAANAADAAFKQEQLRNRLAAIIERGIGSPEGVAGIANVGARVTALEHARSADPEIAAIPQAEWDAFITPMKDLAGKAKAVFAGSSPWSTRQAAMGIGAAAGGTIGGYPGALAGGVLGAGAEKGLMSRLANETLGPSAEQAAARQNLYQRLQGAPADPASVAKWGAMGEAFTQYLLGQEPQPAQ